MCENCKDILNFTVFLLGFTANAVGGWLLRNVREPRREYGCKKAAKKNPEIFTLIIFLPAYFDSFRCLTFVLCVIASASVRKHWETVKDFRRLLFCFS